MSVYIDNFLLALNTIVTLDTLKKSLAIEYNMKDLDEVKTIIGWQVIRDMATRTIKIDQTVFIRDLIIEEELIDWNVNIIPMKASSAIKMSKSDDYDKTDIYIYQ